MSYLDFFCKNVQQSTSQYSESIKGTCYSMCPTDEVELREKENLVHILEVWGPIRKLIKSYSRPAADSNMVVPHMLRPFPVLKDTVQYLLLEVAKRPDAPASAVYDFVDDRLRAIRQDMTIQRIPPDECLQLLEPMTRFYIYFGYKLSCLPISDYDPVLNKKHLLECMKWYLNCCDTTETSNGHLNNLTQYLSAMNIGDKYKLKSDRVLVESLYILSNLDNVQPLFRYYLLPKDVKSHRTLQLVYKIAVANLQGNYVRVTKLMEQLCPLTYCAMCLYLPVLQRNALRVLSHAYNNKRLSVPVDVLRSWLKFSDDAEVKVTCSHYGLVVTEGQVRFEKGLFKTDVNLHQITSPLKSENLDLSLHNVLTYCISE